MQNQMNKYQEALDYINKSICTLLALRSIQDEQVIKNLYILQELVDKETSEVLEDSIDRLEKLEKIIELIKNKKVNMFHIWAFNDYQQYEVHYPFSEYHAEKDMLTKEEYDLLKEELQNDWSDE